MGVFKRPDSKYWWLYLELTKRRERTDILIGDTSAAKKDAQRLAQHVYTTRMHELGSRRHRIPPPLQAMPRLDTFARWYDRNVITHHRGKEREREILPRLVDVFGDYRLHDITPDVVIAWRTTRRTTPTLIEHFGGPKGPRRELPPPSARTVNREVDLLQQILAAAVPQYLSTSPLEGLVDLPVVDPIRRTMTVKEEQRLLNVLALDDRAIFLCALDTLSRLSDVLDLKRTDDHGQHLDIRDPKNGRPHTVPISSRLRAAFDALPHSYSEWYFPRRRGAARERDRRGGFAKALKRACHRACIPYGRAVQGLTFHWATRRTGATRMIRAGGDGAIAVTQRIGNWKDPSVLIGIYQETLTSEMQAAVESISGRVTRGSVPASFPQRPKKLKFRRKSA